MSSITMRHCCLTRRHIDLAKIDQLTGGRLGTFDVPCPLCSAARSAPANRRKPVFRIWRNEEGFATFLCVHCGERGYVRGRDKVTPDPIKLAAARADANKRQRTYVTERLRLARWLWSQRQPILGLLSLSPPRVRRLSDADDARPPA